MTISTMAVRSLISQSLHDEGRQPRGNAESQVNVTQSTAGRTDVSCLIYRPLACSTMSNLAIASTSSHE
jgi:hypothetical protein